MNLKQAALLVFLILFSNWVSAGSNDSTEHPLVVSVNFHHGFMIAHRPQMQVLLKDHSNAVETCFGVKTSGKKSWHHIYGFPEAGLSLSWWNLGNNEQVGSVLAAIPYLDFPIVRKKTFNLNFRFGWGLCYVTKVFDPDENYKNVTIGSHINAAIHSALRSRFMISRRFHADAGLTFLHFSNGSIVTPNLGINVVNISLGTGYHFGSLKTWGTPETQPFHSNRRFTLFGGLGVKQVYPAGGSNYLVGSIAADHNWHLTPKSAFGAGADIFYDSSIDQKMEEQVNASADGSDLVSAGLHGGYELIISDLSLQLQMGMYLYKGFDDDEAIYHRLGIRYRFSRNFFAGVHLKTHWGKADYIETGIGYFLQKQKQP